MQITGVTVNGWEAIVDTVSAQYEGNLKSVDAHWTGGKRITARVAVHDSRGLGARRSWSGRRGPYACWHAYRDVLAELFKRYPDATVRTALAVYRHAEGFHEHYPATAYHNVGSMMQPATMPSLCDCASGIYPNDPEPWESVDAARWSPDLVAA